MHIRSLYLDNRGRLRSGYRFLIFFVCFLILASLLAGLSVPLMESLHVPTATGSAGQIIISCLVALIPALFLGWLCGYLFEALPFAALGVSFTKGWFRNLVFGL